MTKEKITGYSISELFGEENIDWDDPYVCNDILLTKTQADKIKLIIKKQNTENKKTETCERCELCTDNQTEMESIKACGWCTFCGKKEFK